MICFASDNRASVHPKVMEALNAANCGHAPSYGEDAWTENLDKKINEMFGREVYSYVTFSGTGANVAAMAHMTQGYSAVICTDVSHMNTSETGAPERVAGVKLLTVPHKGGKLTVEDIEEYMYMHGTEHYAQPRIVSITQATEFGTVYMPDEIRTISDAAHRWGMYVYMDGARLANAAAYLNVPVADITVNAGVDVVCFGGTKNGIMYGECVLFFDKWFGKRFIFTRKSTAQLPSKSRYISAQFLALFEDNLWLENARHANRCAALLYDRMKEFKNIKIAFPVQTNQIFFDIDRDKAEELKREFLFLEHDGYFRIVTSYDTNRGDIDAFANKLQSIGC